MFILVQKATFSNVLQCRIVSGVDTVKSALNVYAVH